MLKRHSITNKQAVCLFEVPGSQISQNMDNGCSLHFKCRGRPYFVF
ncbi:MAG: hypothetical protein FWE29_03010 [Defluviitaleaceae bacterium]|nr:hypothetical protein [Defluviitaleaceae bacterium]